MKTGQIAELTQLLQSPSGITWSPNGEQIAFSTLVPEDPPASPSFPQNPREPNGPILPA